MGRCNDCKCLIMRCFRGDRCKRCARRQEITEWEEHRKSGQKTNSEFGVTRSSPTEKNPNAVLPGVLRNKIRVLLKKLRQLCGSKSVTKAKVPKLSFSVSVTDSDLGEYLSESWLWARPPDREEGGASPTGDRRVLSEDIGVKVEPVRMNASPFEQSEASQTTGFVSTFVADFESATFDTSSTPTVAKEVVGVAHEQHSLVTAADMHAWESVILEYLRTTRDLSERSESCDTLNFVETLRHNKMKRLQRMRRSVGDLNEWGCVPEQGIWLTKSRERSSSCMLSCTSCAN